jgi:3-oxoacyl-[acyl-carrier-protein] synthase-3
VALRGLSLDDQSRSRAPGSRLVAVSSAQPARVVTGAELGRPFGRSAEWIETRTGIRELRRLSPGEDLLDIALDAGKAALSRSGMSPDDIDVVLAASCSVRMRETSLAARLSAALAPSGAALDLNAACSGFCYALSAADALIRDGSAGTVLIVGAEQMSRVIDPADLGTSIIFGDGAGAAVVTAAEAGAPIGIGPVVWGSDGRQADLIAFGPDGRDEYLRMAGQAVFRWAVECATQLSLDACRAAGVSISDIDVYVPHQANLRIVDAVVRRLGMSETLVADDVVGSGNTSAASVPIALTRLLDDGVARPGQLALLVGFGAGLSYAAQVVVLP